MTDRLPKYEPFDPADPFDAMADMFRRQIGEMVCAAQDSPIFRTMDSERQLQCIMCGIMTGLVGTCFAYVAPTGYDPLMKAIKKYLPHARANAEGLCSHGLAAHGESGAKEK